MNSYNNFNRQAKRFTLGSSSPVYSHLSETLNGITTVLAYDKVDEFEKKLKSKYEVSNQCSRFTYDGSNYLSSYSNLLKNLVLLITTFSLIQNKRNLSAGESKFTYLIFFIKHLTYYFFKSWVDYQLLLEFYFTFWCFNQIHWLF